MTSSPATVSASNVSLSISSPYGEKPRCATVVYSYADFRFESPLPHPVLMRARIENGAFASELWTFDDPGVRVEVEEAEHRFMQDADGWLRENRL